MSQSYQECNQEYNQNLSRVRSFLSGSRTTTTLKECNRLLSVASKCATVMSDLAAVEGDSFQIAELKKREEREIIPLLKEVERAINESESGNIMMGDMRNREELFDRNNANYLAATSGSNAETYIQQSESLLLESRALCQETEQIGSETIQTMGKQSEQLYSANNHLLSTRERIEQAGVILKDMSRKVLRNKMFLYGVIFLLVVANLAVIVAKFRRRK